MKVGTVRVLSAGDDAFEVHMRGHVIRMDQPDTGDSGPAPTEVFVGSFAACVAHFARRFLSWNGVDTSELMVEAHFALAEDRPPRVASIDIDVVLPAGVPERLRKPLERVVDACTIHNTLRNVPDITVTFSEEQERWTA